MSERDFDLGEELYRLGDAPEGATPARLRELAARLEGGQQSADGGPGGFSMLAPEATPPAPAQPTSIEELARRLPELGRAVAGMDPEARRDELWSFADQVNVSLDDAARRDAPHRYPTPGATTDAELEDLGKRILAASIAGDTDAGYGLAEELNRTLDGVRAAHEAQHDQWRQAAVQAARQQRQAKQPATPAGR